MTSAAIFGLAGPRLDPETAAFFRDARPWGFILFARNVETPDQVRALTTALRACVEREDAPILIDQEGGRVQRLGPPHWPACPPARAYAAACRGPLAAREAARLGGRLIAADLAAVGVDVDCAPVCDTPVPGAHGVIGDRAFHEDPETVGTLARAMAEGLIAGGVLPVIKHIPGHGRAMADSHLDLPVVREPLEVLEASDFVAFRQLSDMPMAMTAHVVFAAVDARAPVTTSRRAITTLVRDRLGFEGLLISDDLSMKALAGPLEARARRSHAAGCDIVLHCNGDLDEMRAVAAGGRALAGRAGQRARAALARRPARPEPLDVDAARARLAALLTGDGR